MTDAILVHNIGELATLEGGLRRGAEMGNVAVRRDAAVLIEDGIIEEVGDSEKLRRERRGEVPLLNAGGRAAIPGFVDAHTHAVFAGDRAHEFEMKLKGVSYAQILRHGGGILYTVERTREATRAELLKALLTRLDRMLEHGTTTAEVKTGYGLDRATEARLLQVIHQAHDRHPVELVPTLLAAHAVPPEFKSASDYAEHVAREIVPELADEAEFVDVFCEEGVFSVEDSRRVLDAGRANGLRVKVHADELARSGGSRLAADLKASSADHLLHADESDRKALVEAGVVPVLLPATAFSLGVPYADARALIQAGAPVALATDLNPNCYTESMPLAIALACHGMRMTPAEALSAATVNAAAAVGREADRGAIEPGKQGDLVLLDAPSYVHLPYHFGVNLVWKVLKMGEVVVDRSDRR